MSQSWKLRRYREGDDQAIFQLLDGVYEGWHSIEYWQWRYKNNPAGSAISWVAEHDNEIIGHYALIPLKMKVGNSYVTGAYSSDAVVRPDFQGKGVFSAIANRCYLDAAQNNVPVTYGFADINLGPTYKRYEWRGHICFILRMTNVLNWNNVLARYVHNKWLSSAGGYVLRTALGRRFSDASIKIERITRFDEGIDGFWDEVSQNLQIIVRRDQGYLNWRYVEHPEYKYTIYTAMEDHKTLGYCILTEAPSDTTNLKLGLIVDLLGFQDDRNVVGSLIDTALQRFEDDGVDVVVCAISEKHPYKRILRKTGFIPQFHRREAIFATVDLPGSAIEEKKVYVQALTLSQNPFFKEKGNWFMMAGDGDFPDQ